MIETDVLVLGGGVAGLAAGMALGDRAIVLECGERPGGLVRTTCKDGWWFDHVLHLLYFPDEDTEHRVREVLGDALQPCPPEAWVHARSGVVRFPFQAHLGGLPADVIVRCLADFAERARAPQSAAPAHYREMLLHSFGEAMCDEFFFPYNSKMWRRPLDGLAGSGFHWNIARPDRSEVLRGALSPDHPHRAYNAHGYYPRPGPASARGMEVLSRSLAGRVRDLRTRHEVTRIDPDARLVTARHLGRERAFHYREGLVSTLPLPVMARLVSGLPGPLAAAAARLPVNRVLTACLRVRGPRPEGTGHWRYYADPDLGFTRLIFMHAFDPDSAPPDGWGLMAEIPERGEDPPSDPATVLAKVLADVARTGVLPPASRIVGSDLIVNPYGYVVFERGTSAIVQAAHAALRDRNIEPLGRYGRWEYSSMGQVMRDGFAVGDRQRAKAEEPVSEAAAAAR